MGRPQGQGVLVSPRQQSVAEPVIPSLATASATASADKKDTPAVSGVEDAPTNGNASTGADSLERRLERKLEEQRASLEEAALEAVNSMLAHLRLPTLQQALDDLGLPATGEKTELTARLTDRLTSGIVSARRE